MSSFALDDLISPPISRAEMETLLHPLVACMQRMESTLQELSKSRVQEFSPTLPRQEVSCGVPVLMEVHASKLVGLQSDCQDEHPASNTENGVRNDGVEPPKETPVQLSLADQAHAVQEQAPISPSSVNALQMSKKEKQGSPSLSMEKIRLKKGQTTSCYNVDDNSRSMDLIDEMKINQELRETHFGNTAGKAERLFLKTVEFLMSSWVRIQEPERHSWLYRISSNHTFQTTCMMAIMFNSALVAYVADFQIQHFGDSEPLFAYVLEVACLVFFTIELTIRIGAHRCYFFINSEMHWNIFDFVLVTISLVDLIVDKVIGAGAGSNVGFMRLLRLLKLARIFRSLRSFRFFKSLAVLLESFQKSFVSLFWGLIMLCFVLYLFSLIFMQALLECLTTDGDKLDPLMRQAIVDHFGSLSGTLISLYMSVTGGDDWAKYYEIVSCAGTAYGLVFIFYTFLLNFALFNILTGSLVEKAMASSKPDRADRILNQRKAFAEQRKQFLELCRAMDDDGNGKISRSEFLETMCTPAVLAYMASIGIEVHDVELFFETVAGRDGGEGEGEKQIPIEIFVEGCMHMKGAATSIDMQRQLYEVHLLHKDLRKLADDNKHRFHHVEQLISQSLNPAKQAQQLPAPPVTPMKAYF